MIMGFLHFITIMQLCLTDTNLSFDTSKQLFGFDILLGFVDDIVGLVANQTLNHSISKLHFQFMRGLLSLVQRCDRVCLSLFGCIVPLCEIERHSSCNEGFQFTNSLTQFQDRKKYAGRLPSLGPVELSVHSVHEEMTASKGQHTHKPLLNSLLHPTL